MAKVKETAGARAGALLLKRRNELGLSREAVAAKAKLAVSTVARIELGHEAHPRAGVVGALLGALDANQTFESSVLRVLAGRL